MSQPGNDRILAVFPDHPFPLDMGNRVRNLRILEALSGQFELTIVTLVHDRARLADPGPIAGLGRWVPVLAPHRRGRLHHLGWHLRARLAAAAQGLHAETFFQSPPALSAEVRRLLLQERPKLVHAAYWYTLRHLRPRPRPPLWVVDTHDVQFERQASLWGRRSGRERRQELEELARYDRIIAITDRDRETFTAALADSAPPIDVIGMGLDLEHWRPEGLRPALPPAPRVAYYGNLSTGPNQAGALHLLRDLLPSLRARVSGVEALLIGADPSEELRRAGAEAGARLTGFVEDTRPWLLSSRVLALSLRGGSGLRGRVLEALALGIPVAGYASALEGLDLAPGEGILVAHTPAELQQQLISLLENPEAAAALGRAGCRRVKERFGLAATYARFPALYRRLLEQPGAAAASPSS